MTTPTTPAEAARLAEKHTRMTDENDLLERMTATELAALIDEVRGPGIKATALGTFTTKKFVPNMKQEKRLTKDALQNSKAQLSGYMLDGCNYFGQAF